MFLDLKVLTERNQLHFWTMSTNKKSIKYVFGDCEVEMEPEGAADAKRA